MQHVHDRSPKHIAHLIHEMGTQGLDDCVACHARTAYSLLMRAVKILEPIAMRRRPNCRAAGACARTGLPLSDGEPPHADRCECFVTREFPSGWRLRGYRGLQPNVGSTGTCLRTRQRPHLHIE
jgi:hypothetical protein